MITIDLRRNRLRWGLETPPMRDRDHDYLPYVRLFRRGPDGPTAAPKLHLPGYCATPIRYAALCDGGGYGRVEWHRPRDVQDPVCPQCLSAGPDRYRPPGLVVRTGTRPPRCSRCMQLGHARNRCPRGAR